MEDVAMTESEPIHDVAHLSHVELLTPEFDKSLAYFHDVLGMEIAGERDGSAYLRGFGDYELACLKLTAAAQPGIGHAALRASSRPALERRVAALEASGLGRGWIEGDIGHGPAYQFVDPDDHLLEIFWESERYVPPPELRPALRNQPQRYTARGSASGGSTT